MSERAAVVEKVDHDANPATLPQTARVEWIYDALGRLTGEAYDSQDDSLDFIARYRFDLVGDRTEQAVLRAPAADGFTRFRTERQAYLDDAAKPRYARWCAFWRSFIARVAADAAEGRAGA